VALPPTASEEAKGALRTLWQMAAFHVRRDKAALFQWVQAPPGNRSSRKQPEQAWKRRGVPSSTTSSASEAAPRGLWSAWSMKSMILYVYLSALCFHSPNISRA
jgi:hypothetical protein